MPLILILLVVTLASTPSLARPDTASDSVMRPWDRADSTWAAGDTLRFRHALFRVKTSSPALAAAGHRVRAAFATAEQAGAFPNPNLLLEAENVGGSYSGFDRSELTAQLSQEFPLGSRSNRRDVARTEADALALDARSGAFELYTIVAHRYATVVHAEKRLELAETSVDLLEQLARAADDRVRAGAALVADRLLGQAAVERARIARDDAQSDVMLARRSLGALWGEESGFDAPVAREFRLPEVDPDSLMARAASSVPVRRTEAELRNARASRALERSLRFPSIVGDAGFRRVEVDDANTFVLGLGFPLPLFDRRASGVAAQEARARGLELTLAHQQSESRRETAERIARLQRLLVRLEQTDTVLLDVQRRALDALREAYGIGRVSYSDLLESQRTYVALELERNDLGLTIVDETLALEMLLGATVEESRHE